MSTAIAAPETAETNRLTGRALTALCLAFFLSTFLFASANVSLPVIGADLHASPALQALVLGAFSAVFATLLILFGRLGDNVGRRRVLVWGLGGVAATSILASFAPNAAVLVALRAAQGAAAAAFTPQVLSTIQATTTGARRARAVALVAAMGGLGFSGGQVLGGALLSADVAGQTWRPVFWLAALLSLAALVLAGSAPDTRGAARIRLDHTGAGLLTLALLSLLVALSIGPALGWPPVVWILAGVAIAAIVGFAVHQRHLESAGGAPMIPPSVIAVAPIRLGLVLALLFFAGYGALVYEFAAVSEESLRMTPLVSGLSLVVFALTFTGVSLLAPKVTARIGSWTMPAGAAVQIVGLLTLAATQIAVSESAWIWAIQPALLLVGAGQALQFGPLVSTIMGSVPDRIAGLTGGLVTTVQQASLALGVAVLGGVFVALEPGMGGRSAFSVLLVIHAGVAVIFGLVALALRRRLRR